MTNYVFSAEKLVTWCIRSVLASKQQMHWKPPINQCKSRFTHVNPYFCVEIRVYACFQLTHYEFSVNNLVISEFVCFQRIRTKSSATLNVEWLNRWQLTNYEFSAVNLVTWWFRSVLASRERILWKPQINQRKNSIYSCKPLFLCWN